MKNGNDAVFLPREGLIDFHTHVLPNIDDGAKNAEQSRLMLDASREGGVTALIATPHFDAREESPEEFLLRRQAALVELSRVYDAKTHPALYVGAEVAYFSNIGASEQLRELCIRGTHVLLVEMPMAPWKDRVLEDLYAIMEQLRLIPVIAHVERYIDLQRRGTLSYLAQSGVCFQINAESLLTRRTRKLCQFILRNEIDVLLGSDCHDSEHRPPNIVQKAREMGDGDLASELFYRADILGRILLKGAHRPLEALH